MDRTGFSVRLGAARSLFWSPVQAVPAAPFPALAWAQWPCSVLHYFVWKPRVLCALTTCTGCTQGPYYSSWLCSHRFCTTKVTQWVRQSSVPVLHRLQSGQNIPAMPETCASSEPLTADVKQGSSEDALLSPGLWPGGAWQCPGSTLGCFCVVSMLLRAWLGGCVLPVARLVFSECFLSAGCTLGLQWIYVYIYIGISHSW